MKTADKAYANLRYAEAIAWYEAVLQAEPGNMLARQNLADAYRKIRDNYHAEPLYAQLATAGNADPKNLLYYAQTLATNGKYSEARKTYQQYANAVPEDTRGKNFADAYLNLSSFYADSSAFKIYYINLNSAQSDFSPMYYDKGLVFVSGRKQVLASPESFGWNQTSFLNMYYVPDTNSIKNLYQLEKTPFYNPLNSETRKSTVNNSVQATANDSPTLGAYHTTSTKDTGFTTMNLPFIKPFSGTLNSRYHEGPMSFFNQGRNMIFTRNNFLKGKYKKSAEGINKLKMYLAAKKNESWTDINEFPFNNDQHSVGHPAFSADSKKMYFISDMPGGKGGTDLYVCDYENGNFSPPQNLSNLNTEGNEMFPFIDEKNNLYFASDGW
ncbi:MAG: PD40 domain-containing protein, partial [Verrucomicrobia bacterium]|nr:PD40 domain-containing protein [Cytophagales bacterium]